MPSQTIEWVAKQRATLPRVRRYLRETGRADVAEALGQPGCYLEEFDCHKDESTVDAAVRATRMAGPPPGMREKLAAEIKMMLHASRDAMRIRWNVGADGNRAYDPKKVTFVASDGYYGEAFGIVRAMETIGWGQYGAINQAGCLNEWFWSLQREVLNEEHFGGSGECDWCRKRYGRDDAGRKRETA